MIFNAKLSALFVNRSGHMDYWSAGCSVLRCIIAGMTLKINLQLIEFFNLVPVWKIMASKSRI